MSLIHLGACIAAVRRPDKPAPTEKQTSEDIEASAGQKNVGAGLLAKAVGQLMNLFTDPPPSRASQLPHLDLHISGRTPSAVDLALASTTQVGFQAAVL